MFRFCSKIFNRWKTSNFPGVAVFIQGSLSAVALVLERVVGGDVVGLRGALSRELRLEEVDDDNLEDGESFDRIEPLPSFGCLTTSFSIASNGSYG